MEQNVNLANTLVYDQTHQKTNGIPINLSCTLTCQTNIVQGNN